RAAIRRRAEQAGRPARHRVVVRRDPSRSSDPRIGRRVLREHRCEGRVVTEPTHPSVGSYHETKQRLDDTDSWLKKLGAIAAAIAIVVVLAAAAVGAWSTFRFDDELLSLKHNQVAFHNDTSRTLSTVDCQTKALNLVLTELAAAQLAEKQGQPLPNFVIPKPC